MKIYFRKTLKYNPIRGDLSKYESYEAVTRQVRSPDILDSDSPEHFNLITYCSSLKRCRHTAKIMSSGKIIPLSDLKEIKFSLHSMVTNDEFEKYGSSLVRKKFIESFVNDSLIEKREDIQNRIDRVIKLLTSDNSDKLVISHSFTMKIFEAYLKNKELFNHPKLLRKYFDPSKKTFENGEGFEFDVE